MSRPGILDGYHLDSILSWPEGRPGCVHLQGVYCLEDKQEYNNKYEFRNITRQIHQQQLALLQETLARNKANPEVFDEDQDEEVSKLKEQLAREKERLNKIKLMLAKKTRELRIVERNIDEIPSRAELEQVDYWIVGVVEIGN
jgi:hypothetical protein